MPATSQQGKQCFFYLTEEEGLAEKYYSPFLLYKEPMNGEFENCMKEMLWELIESSDKTILLNSLSIISIVNFVCVSVPVDSFSRNNSVIRHLIFTRL